MMNWKEAYIEILIYIYIYILIDQARDAVTLSQESDNMGQGEMGDLQDFAYIELT